MGLRRGIFIIFFALIGLPWGTSQIVNEFAQKFETFHANKPGTKIHLVFNQDKYVPGDTAFFKAYLLTDELLRVAGKQLTHFYLSDDQGLVRSEFAFYVENGIGYNQLVIPNDIESGRYLVTAFSELMNRRDASLYYKKELVIVEEKALLLTNAISIQAFPEGGNLIQGVPNRICIMTNRPSSVVQIINSKGELIAQSKTNKYGLVSIIITPEINQNYFVSIQDDSHRKALPLVRDDALTVLFTPAGPSSEHVELSLSASPGSTLRKEEVSVLVSGRGRIFQTARFVQGDRSWVKLNIPLADLPNGLAQISLLDNDGKPLASRQFYVPETQNIQAKIELPKNKYKIKEKVQVEVSLRDQNGLPVQGEFSIRVINKALFDSTSKSSMSNRMHLQPEVLSWLPDDSDPNWHKLLDQYLITQSSSILWPEILYHKSDREEFELTNMVEMTGKAIDTNTSRPLPPLTRLLFYFQKNKLFYQSIVLEDGQFSLNISDVSGKDEVYVIAQATNGEEIIAVHIEWNPFEPVSVSSASLTTESDALDNYAYFSNNKRLIDQSYNVYKSDSDHGNESRDFSSTRTHLGIAEPDVVFDIRNYKLFSTMDEMIKEVITPMRIANINGKPLVRIRNLDPSNVTSAPLYLIDGIATKNTSFFLGLKPSNLKTILIVRNRIKLSNLGFMARNGIIMVQTKTGNAREPLDKNNLLAGPQAPFQFNNPDFSIQMNKLVPEFKSTLYWNPSVVTNTDGKAILEFYFTDDIGDMLIQIHGLTATGKFFSVDKNIKVVNDPNQ